MKRNKIILSIIILSIITLVFSGCGGGNPVTPPPVEPDDSNIPEPTEAVSQKIDLSIGGTIEVTGPESPINGVKLIIPPMSSNKDGKDSIASITISYLDNPYAIELPDNQGFLRAPVVIESDATLDTDCILEIPYTEDDLSNVGVSTNEMVRVYRYDYISLIWEEVPIENSFTTDAIFIPFRVEDFDRPYALTIRDSDPPNDLGLPQPGDLLYKLGSILPWEKDAIGWRPGHVGIYVGELVYDGVIYYNVIEALSGGVQRSYYNPISKFSDSDTYMGARQPESGALTSGTNGQRDIIVDWAKAMVGLPYAWGELPGIAFGMWKGDSVKGTDLLGSYNCVGLAEKAYEVAGVNNFEGLVSDRDEGNGILCILPTCILTPAEQYNKTEPAEGYTVSGQVSDSWGNKIPDVILKFDLVIYNNYSNSFEIRTNSDGDWFSNKLGREWNVTPQKDGYTFEPSNLKVKEDANDIDFIGTVGNVCNLPTYSINIKMYAGSESYFIIELKNVGYGYDIYDGNWAGWCADKETYIETNEWYQGYIYCSYNPPNLYNIDWPKINWIINNKGSYSAEYIQDAIWHFTNGYAPNGLAMAAEAYPNFCPQAGQKYVTIIDVPGKQHTFIEVPVD